MPSAISSAPSAVEPGPGDPLSAEARRILDGIPDRIGGEADDPGGPADVDRLGEVDPLAELANQDIVDAHIAGKCISMVLAGVRRIRHRDCYRLDDDALDDLGESWTPCLNGLWRRYAPELLRRLNSSAPDLFKAILATSIAFGPMIAQDMAQSREEARHGRQAGPVRGRGPQPMGNPAGRVQSSPAASGDDLPPHPPAPSGVSWS